MSNKCIKPPASLSPPCFPHFHEALLEGDGDAGCGHGITPASPGLAAVGTGSGHGSLALRRLVALPGVRDQLCLSEPLQHTAGPRP